MPTHTPAKKAAIIAIAVTIYFPLFWVPFHPCSPAKRALTDAFALAAELDVPTVLPVSLLMIFHFPPDLTILYGILFPLSFLSSFLTG